MNIIKGAFSASLIAGSALLTSCGDKNKPSTGEQSGSEKKVLIYTGIPDKNGADLTAKYKPLTEYLSEKLGIEVIYENSAKYSVAQNKFVNNEVQLAWFGGLTGVQARADVPGARAITQGEVDPDYFSYFIAHKSTGLKEYKPSDLKPSETFPSEIADMTFTFGSEKSTSGRLMPTYYIQKFSGKQVDEFFSRKVAFSSGHKNTVTNVNNGSVKVGALSYKTYDKLPAEKKANTVVVWKTPGYYDYNFTAHPSLEKTFGEGFTDKLQKILRECKDPKVLAALQREEGLIDAKNSDFDELKKLAKELKFLK